MDDVIQKPDRATYTPEDFLVWQNNDILDITPKFQRRAVWRTPARSFFMDTILRGMTIPPIYLRLTQNTSRTKTVRQVVDGQQRVRSVLDFIAGKYKLSKNLNADWKNKTFEQLSRAEKNRIMLCGFPTETFTGISDTAVLEIFCRLNMNGIQLNKQELRNGQYFGIFKQSAYTLALKYIEFWRTNQVFGEQHIARMLEVELVSELLIAGNVGMQDTKTSIDGYYKQWEDDYPNKVREEKRFREVLKTISDTFEGDELSESAFHRPPLFYTLYCVIYHHLFGLKGILRTSPKKPLTGVEKINLNESVKHLSGVIEESKTAPTKNAKLAAFLAATQRGTEKLPPRKVRFDTLYDDAF